MDSNYPNLSEKRMSFSCRLYFSPLVMLTVRTEAFRSDSMQDIDVYSPAMHGMVRLTDLILLM